MEVSLTLLRRGLLQKVKPVRLLLDKGRPAHVRSDLHLRSVIHEMRPGIEDKDIHVLSGIVLAPEDMQLGGNQVRVVVELEPGGVEDLPRFSKEPGTPIIWLDIDGVVSAGRFHQNCPWSEEGWQKKNVFSPNGHLTVEYRPEVVEKVNQWSEVAEVKIHSTWTCWVGLTLGPQIGLKQFPTTSHSKWKSEPTPGLLEDLTRPIVWIDDHVNEKGTPGEYDILRTQQEMVMQHVSQPFLIIQPDSEIGLVPDHFDKVDAFLNSVTKR